MPPRTAWTRSRAGRAFPARSRFPIAPRDPSPWGSRACWSHSLAAAWHAQVPVGGKLIAMRQAQHARLLEIVAHELQSHGQMVVAEPAGDGESWNPGQRSRDGVDVVEIHLNGIGGLGPEAEGSGRRGGTHNDVAALERIGKVQGDQPANLLCLQIVCVVVAV